MVLAIHGSYEILHLGRPASHGCIRLHPANAAILFALVKERVGDTSIVVTGERPEPVARSRAREVEKSERPRVRPAAPSQGSFSEDQPVSDAPNFFFLSPSWHRR